MEIHAFAALRPREALQPFSYKASPLGPHDVLLKISHCGICHSDIHLIDNNWKRSIYPLVPGHEVVGTVLQKGKDLPGIQLGNRVGVSWVRSSCLTCPSCLQGETSICPDKTSTCNGHYGGFADHMVADGRFCYPIPQGLGSASAAPLLCAGATVYAPLKRLGMKKGRSVGVIGIGGLGHLGLQFAKAFGCEVTALSFTPSKREEARRFGADHFALLDEKWPVSQFDLILSTVHNHLDWDKVIGILRPSGTLCVLGRPEEPAKIDFSPLISFQKSITGSATASRSVLNEMLAFAAQHKITPQIEQMPLSEVNRAIARLKAGEARYRIVLETAPMIG